MLEWGTASLLEVLWTLIAGIGLGFSLWMLVRTQEDVQDLPRKIAEGDRLRRPFTPAETVQLRIIAYTIRRHAGERTCTLAAFLVAGIRAMLLPPPTTVDSSIGAVLVGVIFILTGAYLTVGAIRDYQDRHKFDRL